ncbi:hypothetical protein Tco_0649924 [Tanacetum coccineum]
MIRVNMFVDMDIELVKESSKKDEAEMAQESSSKRAGEELEQEVVKKQKMEDDKEKEDLKQCFEIVQDDEVAINAIPLATKPAPIVNFQIHKKGRQGYYEIMRADRSANTYVLFSQLLKEFDREDLKNLWKLVKAKHRNTRPEEGYERVLWGDLKTMLHFDLLRDAYLRYWIYLNSRSTLVKDSYLFGTCHCKEVEDKIREKRLQDVSIVQDLYQRVFLRTCLGLPPTRQVEFQIDSGTWCAPVARALLDWRFLK